MSVNDASRIISDDSRVMPLIVASLTDDSRSINYYRNVVIVQATGYVAVMLKSADYWSCQKKI